MKTRKNPPLSPESLAKGRQLAAEAGKSRSAVILATPLPESRTTITGTDQFSNRYPGPLAHGAPI